METWRFGSFRLEVENRSLSRAGTAVSLSPQLFDLLVLLVRHQGQLVTKERLLNEVWQDAFVGDGALTQAVWRLRQTLEDSPLVLQTVPRAGYRLVGDVYRGDPGVSVIRRAAVSPPSVARAHQEPLLRIDVRVSAAFDGHLVGSFGAAAPFSELVDLIESGGHRLRELLYLETAAGSEDPEFCADRPERLARVRAD